MSLRDQLIAKGLVSKKRARQADQQEKLERKKDKGKRRRKKELERAQREAAEAAARAEAEARRERRAEVEDQRQRMERALQIRNLILGHRIRGAGPIRYFHRQVEGPLLLRKELNLQLVQRLQRGEAAIVALHEGRSVGYEIVGREAAERLAELAPHLVVAWNPGVSKDPAELRLSEAVEAPSLRARRATEADLQRLGALSASGAGRRRGA